MQVLSGILVTASLFVSDFDRVAVVASLKKLEIQRQTSTFSATKTLTNKSGTTSFEYYYSGQRNRSLMEERTPQREEIIGCNERYGFQIIGTPPAPRMVTDLLWGEDRLRINDAVISRTLRSPDGFIFIRQVSALIEQDGFIVERTSEMGNGNQRVQFRLVADKGERGLFIESGTFELSPSGMWGLRNFDVLCRFGKDLAELKGEVVVDPSATEGVPPLRSYGFRVTDRTTGQLGQSVACYYENWSRSGFSEQKCSLSNYGLAEPNPPPATRSSRHWWWLASVACFGVVYAVARRVAKRSA